MIALYDVQMFTIYVDVFQSNGQYFYFYDFVKRLECSRLKSLISNEISLILREAERERERREVLPLIGIAFELVER